jgi:RND family efflux transporter MFP subunit
LDKFRTLVLLFGLALSAKLLAAGAPLEVVQAEYRDVPREEAFDAVLEAVNQSTVAAQTSGRVVAVNFDVNDFVSKGDVLLRIDETTPLAQVDAAQGELREAQARASEAQAELERIKGVYEKKLVAKADLDRASANLKAAKARLESARARSKQAREHLSFTEVRAPYSGIVTKRHVEIGETVSPGQALMTGFSLEQIRAAANVPQELLDKLRDQVKARVFLTTLGGREITATRLTFFPFADPVSHTFTVRAELPAEEQGAYPGMFAKVVFQTGQDRRLLVPARAVAHRSEVAAVYAVSPEGKLSFRQVRVGRPRDNATVEILAGLEPGEQVALDPIRAGVLLKEQGERAKAGIKSRGAL